MTTPETANASYAIALVAPSTLTSSMTHVWLTDPSARRATQRRYRSFAAACRAIERQRPGRARVGLVYDPQQMDNAPLFRVAL